MKSLRRKLTLQLTPLLDLMLIVFFLQYLELREREHLQAAAVQTAEQSAVQSAQNVQELQEQLEAARRLVVAAQKELDAEQRRAAELARQLAESDERSQSDRTRLDDVLDRQEVLGRLVAELFGVPGEDVDQALAASNPSGVERSPQELEALRERFEEMAVVNSGRVIQHLLSYEEIRKRCDVWELHLDAQSVATLTAGGQSVRLRVHLTDSGDVDVPRFEQEFFELYRSLPEPKSLVVILLTCSRDTRVIVAESLSRAFLEITRRMTDDARGQSRFEYADLGIRAEQ